MSVNICQQIVSPVKLWQWNSNIAVQFSFELEIYKTFVLNANKKEKHKEKEQINQPICDQCFPHGETRRMIYNPVHNIWEFYKVLVEFPLATSKTKPDI